MSQQQSLKDWQVDSEKKSVQHKSGLVIQQSNRNASSHKPAALDILWIEKLAGTPWANHSNILIEDGLSLLSAIPTN